MWHVSTQVDGTISKETERAPVYTTHRELGSCLQLHTAKLIELLYRDMTQRLEQSNPAYALTTHIKHFPSQKC